MLLTSRRARGAGFALVAPILVAFAGCQPADLPAPDVRPPPIAPAAQDDAAALMLPDLMSFLVDPAAAVVLAAAEADPLRADEPRSVEAWQAVVDAAVQLAQSGRGLALPSMAMNRGDWLAWASAVRDGAVASGVAASQRDELALATAGKNIRAACQGCHQRYAPGLAEPVAARLPEQERPRARARLSG